MTLPEIQDIYDSPFFELLSRAREVHVQNWPKDEVQLCTLLSIKTGGCSEDCAYCAQSARYTTGVKAERMLDKAAVLSAALQAKACGATRFCMGAAWKGVREGDSKFEQVLELVRSVEKLGLEVCVTLGQLTPIAATQLKAAGVTAYNHNLDTSAEYYPKIVSTHTYDDRLQTLQAAQAAGMALCCGGILGLGETVLDRLKLLATLAQLDLPPESIPVNCLIPMPGTPLAHNSPVDVFELIRFVAITRITFPRARVRLSAGRTFLNREAQAFCFFAGANSIFYGGKLLTAKNPEADQDRNLLQTLDLTPTTLES
jgi:biotin synthase